MPFTARFADPGGRGLFLSSFHYFFFIPEATQLPDFGWGERNLLTRRRQVSCSCEVPFSFPPDLSHIIADSPVGNMQWHGAVSLS
jgi:hypothetical protein